MSDAGDAFGGKAKKAKKWLIGLQKLVLTIIHKIMFVIIYFADQTTFSYCNNIQINSSNNKNTAEFKSVHKCVKIRISAFKSDKRRVYSTHNYDIVNSI